MKRYGKLMTMTKKSNWFWFVVLAGLLVPGPLPAIASDGNQDPTEARDAEKQPTETQTIETQDVLDITVLKPSVLAEPPPRSLTVKEQAEPWSGWTPPPTPLLREKKYVAALQIVAPRLSTEQQERAAGLFQTFGNRPIIQVKSRPLPYANVTVGARGELAAFYTGVRVYGHNGTTYSTVLKSADSLLSIELQSINVRELFGPVVQHIPDSQRPSDGSLEFIFRDPNDGLIAGDQYEKLPQAFVVTSQRGLPRMLFYVASPAEAQEIGNAWMTLVDYAVTYPMQQELSARWQRQWEFSEGLPERLAATERSLVEDLGALGKRESMPATVSESIQQRRYNVEIDLQGVRARHEAIRDAMEDRVNGGLVTRLLELQVEAQVELHGLESQLRLMEKMIAEQEAIGQLQSRINQSKTATAQLRSAIEQRRWELEAWRLASEIVQPLEVVDNEIQLYPIEWPERS